MPERDRLKEIMDWSEEQEVLWRDAWKQYAKHKPKREVAHISPTDFVNEWLRKEREKDEESKARSKNQSPSGNKEVRDAPYHLRT